MVSKAAATELSPTPRTGAEGGGATNDSGGGGGGSGSSSIPPSPTAPEPACPFVVLGVALVVDQLGKGARMVFRYPTAPPPPSPRTLPALRSSSVQSFDHDGDKGGPAASTTAATDDFDDLFFRLPSRQMAKLFRPKPALCGQPLTLTVERTVFLCCSTLMDTGGGGDTGAPFLPPPGEEGAVGSTVVASATASGGSTPANNSDNDNAGSSPAVEEVRSNLALFSVIVAIVSHPGASSTLPISSWMEGGGRRSERRGEKAAIVGEALQRQLSASFLSVRRVHVSLSRLCRVLAREERRCRYVSLQAELFQSIRADLLRTYRANQMQLQQPLPTNTNLSLLTANPTAGGMINPSSSVASGGSPMPGPAQTESRMSRGGGHRHRKTLSFGRGELSSLMDVSGTIAATSTEAGDDIVPEIEQEVVETIMASNLGSSSAGGSGDNNENEHEAVRPRAVLYRSHLGNLARELAQVYHALGKNDRQHDLAPSLSDLLTGRNGIVYVNRHIAVTIEPLSLYRRDSNSLLSDTASTLISARTDNDISWGGGPTIRPYHTLLFLLTSPVQLLEALRLSSGSSGSNGGSQSSDFRRLQQLLVVASPRKDLRDMATDASLTLSKALELARYLASQGACVGSPVLNQASRFGCGGADRIFRAALPFSQAFGPSINLFSLAGFLAADESGGRTLGESIRILVSSRDPRVARLREGIVGCSSSDPQLLAAPVAGIKALDRANSPPMRPHALSVARYPSATSMDESAGRDLPGEVVVSVSPEHLEEALSRMAAWMLSRRVLHHRVDFLVASFSSSSSLLLRSDGLGRARISPSVAQDNDDDDHDATGHDDGSSERKYDGALSASLTGRDDSVDEDEVLFRELLDAGLLDGRTSVQSCCWKLGWWESSISSSSFSLPYSSPSSSSSRLLSWASRHPRVRVASREPTARDDW